MTAGLVFLLGQRLVVELLLPLFLGTPLIVFWYSIALETEILRHFFYRCWTVTFSWSFSAPTQLQPVLTPAQVCKETCN